MEKESTGMEGGERRKKRKGVPFGTSFFPTSSHAAKQLSVCLSVTVVHGAETLLDSPVAAKPFRALTLEITNTTPNSTTDFQRFNLQQASNTTRVQTFLASWLLVAFYYALQVLQELSSC